MSNPVLGQRESLLAEARRHADELRAKGHAVYVSDRWRDCVQLTCTRCNRDMEIDRWPDGGFGACGMLTLSERCPKEYR